MTRPTESASRPSRWLALAASLVALHGAAVHAAGRTYTLDADFDLGVLSGVNHDAPNGNQLQINRVGTTFPVMWIANGGEDTVSKIDTATNKEVARYRTWFGPAGQAGHFSHINDPFAGPAPSRTAVDLAGNAYVANRWFSGARQAWVIKILAEGGIDRNGNGVIDTSIDTSGEGQIASAEMLPMADTNGNNRIDPEEIQDERIAWAVSVGNNNGLGRALCIAPDGNLWVGLYNAATYYKISAADGSVLAGPIPTTPTAGRPNAGAWTPYGCLIDANGTLWSASLSSVLGKIENAHLNPSVATPNPYTVSSFSHPGQNYGIALGHGRVFLGLLSGGSYLEFDPSTNTSIVPAALSFAATGISVDAAGDIVSGPYSGGGIAKFRWSADNTGTCATNPAKNGCVIWSRSSQLSSETRGVIADANNDIWQVSRTGNVVMKHRGSDGAPLGVYPVGNHPYTYSDATGLSQRTQTNLSGTWTVVYDSGVAATPWGRIHWTDAVPAGANVTVQARSADSVAGLSGQLYQAVAKGATFAAAGRFIQIEARLAANVGRESPTLFDLTVNSLVQACDVDGDNDIDVNDIVRIRAGIGQTPVANDPRDANGDGKITVGDARTCTLRCTRAQCAP